MCVNDPCIKLLMSRQKQRMVAIESFIPTTNESFPNCRTEWVIFCTKIVNLMVKQMTVSLILWMGVCVFLTEIVNLTVNKEVDAEWIFGLWMGCGGPSLQQVKLHSNWERLQRIMEDSTRETFREQSSREWVVAANSSGLTIPSTEAKAQKHCRQFYKQEGRQVNGCSVDRLWSPSKADWILSCWSVLSARLNVIGSR